MSNKPIPEGSARRGVRRLVPAGLGSVVGTKRSMVVLVSAVVLVTLGVTGSAFALGWAGSSFNGPHARLSAAFRRSSSLGRPPVRQAIFVAGTVTSVNGASTAQSCGTAGASGAFVLRVFRGPQQTVDVKSATTYEDSKIASPSFADVCVGARVAAYGNEGTPRYDGTSGDRGASAVTATHVYILSTQPAPPPPVPPRPTFAAGTVTSVDGSSSTGMCGTAGVSGKFVLSVFRGPQVTVDVTGTTTFTEPGTTSPTFADVCVGAHVAALGASGSPTITATRVFISPPVPPRPVFAAGTVTSVNGSSATGMCGTAGASGTFALSVFNARPPGPSASTVTVDATSTTTFTEPGTTSPTFADVCVGAHVAAFGTDVPTTITATGLFISPPPPPPPPPAPRPAFAAGTVTSVNGSSATGMCGTAGGSGSFVLSVFRGPQVTIDVTGTTTFTEPGTTSPTFADVCVGAHVAALGASGSPTITATRVFILPPPPPFPRHLPRYHFSLTSRGEGFPTPGRFSGAVSTTVGARPGGIGSSFESPGFTPQATPRSVVSGTVTALGASSITVTTEGEYRTIVVTGSTRYVGTSGPPSLASVVVGDIVQASGTTVNGAFSASTVDVLESPHPVPPPSADSSSGGGGRASRGSVGPPPPRPAPSRPTTPNWQPAPGSPPSTQPSPSAPPRNGWSGSYGSGRTGQPSSTAPSSSGPSRSGAGQQWGH